jgi:hypothetical protein
MKKIIPILCCLICIQYYTCAQNILALETATINGSTVITPVLPNLVKLLKASKSDFVATVKGLSYSLSKPDDPNTYQASNPEQVYNVDKEDQNIDIFFSDNGSYTKKVKDDFLAAYPNARYKAMDGGIQAYYFDMNDGGDTVHYCIFFDLPADGGGGVTLLILQ